MRGNDIDSIVELSHMPGDEGIARVRLVVERQGIHVYLGEREVWIEVSEQGDLIARAYYDQHTEDNHITLTILKDRTIVEDATGRVIREYE